MLECTFWFFAKRVLDELGCSLDTTDEEEYSRRELFWIPLMTALLLPVWIRDEMAEADTLLERRRLNMF